MHGFIIVLNLSRVNMTLSNTTSIKQGWKAKLDLGFTQQSGQQSAKTVLSSRSQSGPLTVQRPFYPEGDVCHLYLLHPPGGVVGGDELHINITLSDQANALLTTPGATKFYRSADLESDGSLAHQVQTLKVGDQCSLEWFPQENIFFDEAHTHLSTRIELEKTAHFIGWEINCYGRPASNDPFKKGIVKTRLELYRDAKPIILDGLLVNNSEALQSATSLNGYPCFGTLMATDVSQDLLDKVRELLAKNEISSDYSDDADNNTNCLQIGITRIDDILIARCLGQYSEQISTTLKQIWSILRPDVLKREACHPRIWST